MSSFRKYDHVERLGHREVRDIELGEVHVFPKLDGTNASAWADHDGEVRAGSRNRVIDLGSDNAGFARWLFGPDDQAENLRLLALGLPHLVFYGEWLVPHAVRTYQEDAWRRFYVFDVYDRDAERYLPFEQYQPALERVGIDYIAPLAVIKNPSPSQLQECVDRNDYLVTEGVGEGIVLKNYSWRNAHGRQPWAKVIAETFANGSAKGKRLAVEGDIAADIVEKLATPEYIRKEFAKVVTLVANETAGADIEHPELYGEFVQTHRHAILPRFMGTLLYDFMSEHVHDIVKKWKKPLLDIGRVDRHLKAKAREVMSEVF